MLFTSLQCFYYWRLLENTIRLEVRASLEENSEAATRGSVKKVFLEISQKSQESTCAKASGLQLY